MSPTGYETVIGLEVHVHLATRTKMFCGCPNRFGAEPNSLVCPVCLGLPGSLPVVNREGIRLGLLAALALQCRVPPLTKFDRKNYFYPDLPKGYQISQYDLPLARDGYVEIRQEEGARRVRIHRVHLEEDAGKLVHPEGGKAEFSLVDLNRAGVPLLEIVTEPDLRSPSDAHAYLAALKQTLQYAGVSDCDMEKGSLRCDANVSVRPAGEQALGTKVEIKNLNSFRFVEQALVYEVERQTEVLSRGDVLPSETRLFDADAGMTRTLRSKEEAHDYRYFPEPDLPPLAISASEVEDLRAELPEMPDMRRRRFLDAYGLPAYDVGVLTADRDIADYFEEGVRTFDDAKAVGNWVMTRVLRRLKETGAGIATFPIDAARLARLARMQREGVITSAAAGAVFDRMLACPDSPERIVDREGLAQVRDAEALDTACRQALTGNAKAVADYRGGKTKAIAVLVGAVMQRTRGTAHPGTVKEILTRMLEEPT